MGLAENRQPHWINHMQNCAVGVMVNIVVNQNARRGMATRDNATNVAVPFMPLKPQRQQAAYRPGSRPLFG